MEDYSKMTTEDFDKLLMARMADMSPHDLLSIPGIYEILSEHLNNDILNDWKEEQEMENESKEEENVCKAG